MNKQEIYDLLASRHINYEVVEHGAVYNMAEMAAVQLPHAETIAKNLFLRDENRKNYYLVSVKGEKRVDLKAFRRNNGTRRLTFADDADLKNILGLVPGSVSPLGLLNDAAHSVLLFLDRDFMQAPSLIGIHPNDNTATIFLRTTDLVQLIESSGSEVRLTDVSAM